MTEQQPRKRRQRRMVNLDIQETSVVDFPAHGVHGWVLAKSADSRPARVSKRELAELFGTDFTKDADKPADKPAGDDLPAGAFSLKEHEAYLVSRHLENVKPGEEVDFTASGKGAKLGKTANGTPYLTTPASIARAVGEQWAKDHNVGQRRI